MLNISTFSSRCGSLGLVQLIHIVRAVSAAKRLHKDNSNTAVCNLIFSFINLCIAQNLFQEIFDVPPFLQSKADPFLSSVLKCTLSVSLSSPESLPWRVQVQGELAREQLQRLRVSGLQRLLHSTQQAWPHEEGQQGHHCHDCNALPTPNMMSENWQ